MLTLVHEGLAELAAAMPDVAANVGPGWEAVLANLDKTLAAGGQQAAPEHPAIRGRAPVPPLGVGNAGDRRHPRRRVLGHGGQAGL
jgi:hypothetical protein